MTGPNHRKRPVKASTPKKKTAKARKAKAPKAKSKASKPKAAKPKAPKPKPKAAKSKAPKPKPKASKPKAAKPKASKPKAAKPKAPKPKASKPKAAKPKAPKPKASKPKAVKPKASNPKAAKPKPKASKRPKVRQRDTFPGKHAPTLPASRAPSLRQIRARLGTDVVARQFGVPTATVRRWLSQGLPQSRNAAFKAFAEKQAAIPTLVKSKQKKQLVRRRAENRQAGALAAKATRLQKASQWRGSPGISRNAAEMWAALPRATGERVLNIRALLLQGAAVPNQTDALRQMLDEDDDRALAFLAECEALGLSPAAARSAYFSPKARKVGAMPG